MKSFVNLTSRGKIRRLHGLAWQVMQEYDLDVRDIQLVGEYTNVLFRVRTVDGSSYVLRICTPGWRTANDVDSEVMWLNALAEDTDIGAPVPMATRDGDNIVDMSVDGIPGPRRCLLMSWVPGPLLGKHLTEANLYQMGVLFTRLHEHAAGFKPLNGFTRRKMDRIYARDEEVVLFGASCQDAFTPHTRDIFERTLAQVNQAFQHLYADPSDLRVIHNDLHHDNIKVDHGHLRPLDFEDTLWGYPVQDIAMALQDLMTAVEPGIFDPLQRAFRQGYESRLTWPESSAGQIDTFRAGRMLWVTNYVARYERQYLRQHIDWLVPVLEAFLETGRLRLHG